MSLLYGYTFNVNVENDCEISVNGVGGSNSWDVKGQRVGGGDRNIIGFAFIVGNGEIHPSIDLRVVHYWLYYAMKIGFLFFLFHGLNRFRNWFIVQWKVDRFNWNLQWNCYCVLMAMQFDIWIKSSKFNISIKKSYLNRIIPI